MSKTMSTNVSGNLIRLRRRRKGLTCQEVADAVCVSEDTVMRWEYEGVEDDWQHWDAVAAVLGVEKDAFFPVSTERLLEVLKTQIAEAENSGDVTGLARLVCEVRLFEASLENELRDADDGEKIED